MTLPRLRYLIFDLGGTLMHARGEWAPVHEHGDRALVQALGNHAIQLDSRKFRARLHEYYAQRDRNQQETTYHFVLNELLNEMGYTDVPEPILRTALDAMYAVTRTNWTLEDDTRSTLEELRRDDYRLGILSNAGDDKDVQELIQGFDMGSYFDFVLTSAKCFYRKPHPRAFELALAHWSIPPREAVMIGDNLEADIQGAKNINMQAIWISRRAQFDGEQLKYIHPDFKIRTLDELPSILDGMTIA